MLLNKSIVLSDIVDNNLCIGCGACVTACPTNSLKMNWNQNGIYEPYQVNACDLKAKCIESCPFDINIKNKLTDENYMRELIDAEKQKLEFSDEIIGKYSSLFVGYSHKYRLSSSSGGMITWLINKLLLENKADYVISVGDNREQTGNYFDYMIYDRNSFSEKQSGTKYYPVQLSDILEKIINIKGRYILIGVPCYIKAIRQLQTQNEILKDRIILFIGLFCGGMKNKFYTEYLSSTINVEKKNIDAPDYRIKDIHGSARDYSFGCSDLSSKEFKSIKMKKLPDMWGTGLFKPNACDFCDDISAELADISFGDAWIPPYDTDGKGFNIIISRRKELSDILLDSEKSGEIYLDRIQVKEVKKSQRGNITHRVLGLMYRLKWTNKNNISHPPKRVKPVKWGNFVNKKIFYLRMLVRNESTEIWKKLDSNDNLHQFNKEIIPLINKLMFWTRLNHKIRRIKSLFNLKSWWRN